MIYYARNKIRNTKKKNQTDVGSKREQSTKENTNSWRNKNRIRSQQIRESCDIQPINEWV